MNKISNSVIKVVPTIFDIKITVNKIYSIMIKVMFCET